MRNRKRLTVAVVAAALAVAGLQAPAMAQLGASGSSTDGPTPGEAYAAMEYGVFMHYGLATYVGQTPWNYDPHDVPATTYDPPNFDPDQWMDAIAASGANYVVFTAKHHDGFTMWPSEYTDYGVQTSSDPDTDVVGEVVRAARDHGLKVVLYYSWYDRLQPGGNVRPQNPNSDRTTDDPQYMAYAKNQIRELLTDYGHIEGLWMDIAPMDDVQLPELADFIHTVSPGTALVANFPSAIRDANDAADVATFEGPYEMMPCDYEGQPPEQAYTVSSGPGWWQASDEALPTRDTDGVMTVMSSTNALDGTFSLNVSPGPSGQLPPGGVRLLEAVGDRKRGDDLLADAQTTASMESDDNPASAATDLLTKTQWRISSGADPAWLQVNLDQPVTINRTALQLSSADAVTRYRIEYQDSGGEWRTAHTGGAAQYPTQTDQFEPITTSSLRLIVEGVADGAGVVEFKAYGGIDDVADTVQFSGHWQAQAIPGVGAFGNTIHRSRHAGDTATFSFVGNGVELRTSTGPGYGTALVSIDGGDPVVVDLDDRRPHGDQAVLTQRGLDDGSHTLTVEVARSNQWVSVDRITPLSEAVPGLSDDPIEELPDGRLIYDDGRPSTCGAAQPILYSGAWESGGWSGAHNDTRHYSREAGAAAELTFEGTGVEVMTQTRPGHGIAAISVDGGEPELVDTYSNPAEEQVIVWTQTGLAPGEHTVRIEVTGDKNPAATNSWVALDAIIVTP